MTAAIDTMFSVREVPWHGLGMVVEEAPSSEEALQMAGLDWEVQQSELVTSINGLKVNKYLANVRSDTGETLGIVTGKYKIVQNHEAFAFTDDLVSQANVKYETAGSLRNGQQVWMLARLDEHRQILGDEITPYLCFTNTHDGTGAVKVMMTPVRVVCQNTLNMAVRGAARKWSTNHMGNIEKKMEEAKRTLELADKYLDTLEETAEKLVEVPVTLHDWKGIVSEVLPIPEKASEKTIETIELKRTKLFERIHAADIAKFKGTGWAAINAVTDFIAHVPPQRMTSTYNENLFAGVVNGHILLDRVVDLLKVS